MTTTDLEPVSGGTELVAPAAVPAAPLLPMTVEQAQGAMRAYQELCAAVLAPADWIGNPGEPESFVRRSGWQKLATFYGVSTELVADTRLERNDEGELMRASARARAIARDGRHADAGGACARNEKRFANARGREKIEHDLPATAETRAQNRAVANLIGFGAVSAEEVDAAVTAGPDLPPWAADVPDDAVDRIGAYLATILTAAGVDDYDRRALEIGSTITNYCDGVFPAACARLTRLLAQATSHPAPAEADVVEPEREYGVAPDDSPAAAAPDAPPEGDTAA